MRERLTVGGRRFGVVAFAQQALEVAARAALARGGRDDEAHQQQKRGRADDRAHDDADRRGAAVGAWGQKQGTISGGSRRVGGSSDPFS